MRVCFHLYCGSATCHCRATARQTRADTLRSCSSSWAAITRVRRRWGTVAHMLALVTHAGTAFWLLAALLLAIRRNQPLPGIAAHPLAAVTNYGNSGKTMLKYGLCGPTGGDCSYWNTTTYPSAIASDPGEEEDEEVSWSSRRGNRRGQHNCRTLVAFAGIHANSLPPSPSSRPVPPCPASALQTS